MRRLRIGIDVGGTFTDVVAADPASGRIWHHKQPSTPEDPARAILLGTTGVLSKAGASGADVVFFGHGTTVTTNMILERKGARLAVLTTRGFRDVLDLGRQARPHVYDYRVRRPAPLAARRDRFEVSERISAEGEIVTPLDTEELAHLATALSRAEYDAVAVCFLHAYCAPQHEARAIEELKRALPTAFLTASHVVAPEIREFERCATTALNGFVGPRAERYFSALEEGLRAEGVTAPLYTVTSNAGLVDLETAKALPVRTALSGPAAGVRGIGTILGRHGLGDLVTFDVGGTSTDIAILPDGEARTARTREVNGHPVLAPMVDVEVIGAGGGSIAKLDPGGALTVGPESAGADPGPAAYGRGGASATVTDAALVLGRIGAGTGLAGEMMLDLGAAEVAIQRWVAEPLGLTAKAAAEGLLDIATAGMARTIRSAALSRGVEPGRLCLVAYGGAGPLLGAEVAAALGIGQMVVPVAPGTLCARAILVSDIARDFSRTRIATLGAETDLASAFRDMRADGAAWLGGEGVDQGDRAFDLAVECRYAGQNFEIAIPVHEHMSGSDLRADFDMAHAEIQGFELPQCEVEMVTYRLRAHARLGSAPAPRAPEPTGEAPRERTVTFNGQDRATAIWRRSAIAPGAKLAGPAIIEEATSTTVVPPGWACTVLDDGTLDLTHRRTAP